MQAGNQLTMAPLSQNVVSVLAESLSAAPVATRRAVFEPLARFHGVGEDEIDAEFEAVLRAIPPTHRCVKFKAWSFDTDAIYMHRLSCSAQARLCKSSHLLF
jgi:hypothetical protein